jgi:predicted MFS family arabinose efflux permease
MALLLPLLALADSVWLMAIALALFGGALGSLDVAMNVHAVEVERNVGRPMMSGFHALFSVGGFCGAAFVTAMLSHSISPTTATLVCSVLMVVAVALTAPRLLATPTTTAGQSGALMALPRGPVVILSVLAAITFLVEGALLDWSALLLTDMNLSTPERAGVGYAVFSVAMTVGRFSGDAITARFGDKSVVFWGGLAVLGGFTSLLTMNNYVMAMAGFVLIGLGASNVVPVLFRQAGAQNAMPTAMAISAVTTIGYAGQLLGPAVMGFISMLAGLQAAFWMLAALMCLVPAFARTASNSRGAITKVDAT